MDQIKQLKNVALAPGCLAHDHLQHNCVTFGNGRLFLRLRLQSPVCCVCELSMDTVVDEEEHVQTDRQADRQARVTFPCLKPIFSYQTPLFI